jgi:hypothetical protein
MLRAAGILFSIGLGVAALGWLPDNASDFNPKPDPPLELHPTGQAGRILERSCRDCHSYHTRWPWYTRISFVRQMVATDVQRARKAFNISEWNRRAAESPEDAGGILNGICEEVTLGVMPPKAYLLMHPAARVSAQDVHELCAWTAKESTKHVVH